VTVVPGLFPAGVDPHGGEKPRTDTVLETFVIWEIDVTFPAAS
jgi:hypothetical protein